MMLVDYNYNSKSVNLYIHSYPMMSVDYYYNPMSLKM